MNLKMLIMLSSRVVISKHFYQTYPWTWWLAAHKLL